MKLLGVNTSPYGRKTPIVLLEKNISHACTVGSLHELGSQAAWFVRISGRASICTSLAG